MQIWKPITIIPKSWKSTLIKFEAIGNLGEDSRRHTEVLIQFQYALPHSGMKLMQTNGKSLFSCSCRVLFTAETVTMETLGENFPSLEIVFRLAERRWWWKTAKKLFFFRHIDFHSLSRRRWEIFNDSLKTDKSIEIRWWKMKRKEKLSDESLEYSESYFTPNHHHTTTSCTW